MTVTASTNLRANVAEFSVGELANAIKKALEDGFGQPHRHAGLGIRRLRKGLFECRAGLQWRIVFYAEKGVLSAYDVMTHDEVKAWLRSF